MRKHPGSLLVFWPMLSPVAARISNTRSIGERVDDWCGKQKMVVCGGGLGIV